MISVIIPTLMRVSRIYQTLIELSRCKHVGEIILIDNTINTTPIKLDKLIHICEGKNTYVNPAWNKGVELAKYDKLCILNDDLWFDWNKLGRISDFISDDFGIIGMSPNNYSNTVGELKLIPTNFRSTGFGCCFFIHRNNWDIIPNDLKLWCGDDWIFYRSNHQNFYLDGLKCDGFISASMDDKSLSSEIDLIKIHDMYLMSNLIKKGEIFNYLQGTIWENYNWNITN